MLTGLSIKKQAANQKNCLLYTIMEYNLGEAKKKKKKTSFAM